MVPKYIYISYIYTNINKTFNTFNFLPCKSDGQRKPITLDGQIQTHIDICSIVRKTVKLRKSLIDIDQHMGPLR